MAVDVEVSLVPMHALAHKIRHPADRKNIPGAVKGERVRGIKALAGCHLVVDGHKARIVRLKGMGLKSIGCVRTGHCLDDIAGASRWAIASRLLVDYDAVPNLAVFVFGQDTPGYQLMGIGERTLGDDALGLMRVDSWQ